MSIRRNPQRGRWTVIGNDALEDRRLSLGATGLLAYILSKPDNWIVRTADVMARGNMGRAAYSRMMGELEAAGYANLVKTRGDDGKATGSYWDVSECPVDRVSENPTFGKPGSIVSTDAVVSTETAVSTENRGATAAEQGAAKKGRGSSGQPKARKARDPGPWAAFRDQALTDYGQPSTGPTQALVTRIVKTAEYHGLDPGQASMAWGRWRSETLVNDTAKYHPLHLAAQSWGEWLAARKLAHQARLARAESREVNE